MHTNRWATRSNVVKIQYQTSGTEALKAEIRVEVLRIEIITILKSFELHVN